MFGFMKLLINYVFRQQHVADNHTGNDCVYFSKLYTSLSANTIMAKLTDHV